MSARLCRLCPAIWTAIALPMLGLALAPPAGAQTAEPETTSVRQEPVDGVDRARFETTVLRGLVYLRSIHNVEDGSFAGDKGPGVTALIVTALLRNGVPAEDPVVARSLAYLESFIDPETGGIHAEESLYMNYETCLAILCFVEANRDGRYDQAIANADRFIKHIQWGGPENSVDEDDFAFGGAGYGTHQRPDLSNTSYLVEALVASGNDAESEAIQRALAFVSRSQNLEGPENSAPFAVKNPDGGFYYTPAAGGQSQAGTTENGGLRSYGSMTYAGLKSMIYAGVDADDPRVKAALEWISEHYRLDENPNMGAAGLYYYYHTFAKALHAAEIDQFTDADGTEHDWRAELLDTLADHQRDDGSWVNSENPRWMEGESGLVTAYALLALSYCRDDAERPEAGLGEGPQAIAAPGDGR